MTRVASGAVRSKRTLLTASMTYQSMLCPTTCRPPAATATAVQWSPERDDLPVSEAAGSSAVNSSPQLRTSSRKNGTPDPSERPSSSSTYRGSQRLAARS
jgi:hypothetical protein